MLYLLNEGIKIKLGAEEQDLEMMTEEKLKEKDAEFEKKLGSCQQNLEKLKADINSCLDDLSYQITIINYDNFGLFY
eukprot:CAMPEP_0202958992 /NCGR_PEP_ID=MMETSP1396-20130829/3252_1 /ASSEMBLY_ACC=CAM_ASM_000872 /TAXON_ID= /ORGANISM="Pseudokeronopsis sp., Strain Brazil" /LENGTH=76 /DNA_ID=CAMNT_0049677335 /DNA_START=83 /DNA_END=313 /DNA_ORIENTATION=-